MAIASEAFVEDDSQRLGIMMKLGNHLVRQGRNHEARVLVERALETIACSQREGLGGVEAYLRLQLGDILLDEGQHEEAKPSFERSAALMEAHYGAEHVHIQAPTVGLARCLLAEADPEGARELVERVLPVLDQADDTERVTALLVLADAQWALGERTEARGRVLELQRHLGLADPESSERWLREHPASATGGPP